VGTTASEINAVILAQPRKVDDIVIGRARRAQVKSRMATETPVRKCLEKRETRHNV
jgi:hypothetical protein